MMRIKFQILVWLTIILAASSCKKDELPPDKVGNPVFQSDFSFDGNPYQLIAGVSGLSMEVNTYFSEDTIVFGSSLESQSCEACGPALFIELISPDLIPEWGNQDFQGKLQSWNYAFAQESEGDSTLTVLASSQNSSGIWFLDGIAQNTQPIDNFEFLVDNYGDHEIKLENVNPGCGIPAIQEFRFNGVIPCYANVVQGSGANMNQFTVLPYGGFSATNEIFMWTYGDTTAVTTVPSFIAPNLNGIAEMCVEISEPGGCSQSVCINIAPTPITCVTNFTIDSMMVNQGDAQLESALMQLTFIDDDNVEYSSSNQIDDQPSFTNIQLLEASPYSEPTEPNRSFIKLRFEIQCLLYDELGNGRVFNGIVETAFEDPGL